MDASIKGKDGVSFTRAYRLYVWLGSVRYYANRSDPELLPRVRWSSRSQEYPDHFTHREASMIKEFYIDQAVRIEEVILSDA